MISCNFRKRIENSLMQKLDHYHVRALKLKEIAIIFMFIEFTSNLWPVRSERSSLLPLTFNEFNWLSIMIKGVKFYSNMGNASSIKLL